MSIVFFDTWLASPFHPRNQINFVKKIFFLKGKLPHSVFTYRQQKYFESHTERFMDLGNFGYGGSVSGSSQIFDTAQAQLPKNNAHFKSGQKRLESCFISLDT